jgi:hypothetical protein
VDVSEEHIAFLIVDCYPVAREYQVAPGKVAQAAHSLSASFCCR